MINNILKLNLTTIWQEIFGSSSFNLWPADANDKEMSVPIESVWHKIIQERGEILGMKQSTVSSIITTISFG